MILHPGKLALIYGLMKKTDQEDSLKLARIIEQLPKVALPSDREMRRRELIAAHSGVVKYRIPMINV